MQMNKGHIAKDFKWERGEEFSLMINLCEGTQRSLKI